VFARRLARRAVACWARTVRGPGREQRPPVDPPTRPTQFVVGEAEHGNPKLEVVEGTFEQTYRVGDHHSVALFLSLSRAKGLLPYRRARQHEGTLCERAALSEHDALWSELLELDRRLGNRLAEVTRVFLREHLAPTSR
jgi:hypothetical protein